MKRLFGWQALLGIALIGLSAATYALHYLVFKDTHHIFIYLLGDVAFVPIEVLLVTLIIHKLLAAREKKALMGKMYMVIGTFFGEVGTEILRKLSRNVSNLGEISGHLDVKAEWTERDFRRAKMLVLDFDACVSLDETGAKELQLFLSEKGQFLMRLLENPNLLEHEGFSDMLWAVVHLYNELKAREGIAGLPKTDIEHLSGDVQRAYVRLLAEWISYMEHLKRAYPFLFSLAVRISPMRPGASPVVA